MSDPLPPRETSEVSHATGERRLVPRSSTLAGFVEEVSRVDGLRIADLEPITPLVVRTENSLYRITVLEPRGQRILVQGGSFFPVATAAHLEGSSLGGSLLKQGWIGPGLRMEISSAGRRIVTSRVRSMEIHQDGALPGPF